jgi:hypothetical protein
MASIEREVENALLNVVSGITGVNFFTSERGTARTMPSVTVQAQIGSEELVPFSGVFKTPATITYVARADTTARTAFDAKFYDILEQLYRSPDLASYLTDHSNIKFYVAKVTGDSPAVIGQNRTWSRAMTIDITATSKFLPSGLPGLSLWLKADAGVTLSGANITAWADQSGNGRTVTLTNSPSFTASSINSRPTVDFNGSTQFVDALTPAFVGNNNFSVIWAFKYVGGSTAGNSYSPSVSFLSAEGDDQGAFHYIKNESKFSASYPLFLTQAWTPYDYTEGFTYSDGSNYILEFISNQSSGLYSVFRNATLEGSEAIGTAADSDVIGIRIAGQSNPERYGNIKMAEIVVYDRVLTTPERQQVEAYLNSKYGIY